MDVKTERGFLVLADLSGYTSFLARAELDHAQAIVRELLEMVSTRLSSLLTLVEVEGDALYVYAPDGRIHRGETLLELIESTYVEFRDRLGSMKRHTTCGCVACSSVQSLDLKFFTHFGEYVPRKIAGSFKLIGSSVNLLHRLTKNHVNEQTGWQGYALFTDAALERLNVQPNDLHTSTEYYEHLGEVRANSIDLHERHRELTEARRVFIEKHEADVVKQRQFACPPPVLWEWLNDPLKRNMWMDGVTWTARARPGGRTGPGATNHCAHGKGGSVEHIVDWRPFEYFSTETKAGVMTMVETVALTPTTEGTDLSHRVRIEMPLPRFLIKPVTTMVVRNIMRMEERWERIDQLVKDDSDQKTHIPEPVQ